MTRIRYSKIPDGTLVSNHSIITPKGIVDVLISPEFFVSLVDTDKVTLLRQQASNLIKAKKLAKAMLIDLGATFIAETRVRSSEEVLAEEVA